MYSSTVLIFYTFQLGQKKALPSWLVISKGWDNKNVSRTQTWQTLFLFPRPYFVIKRAQIMLESNNSNLNWPLYDIVISNILVWALIISFWWRYGYIFNICSKSFPNPQIFPRPCVAQVRLFSCLLFQNVTFFWDPWNLMVKINGGFKKPWQIWFKKCPWFYC